MKINDQNVKLVKDILLSLKQMQEQELQKQWYTWEVVLQDLSSTSKWLFDIHQMLMKYTQ